MTPKDTYKLWNEIVRPYTGGQWWHPALMVFKYQDWMENEVRTAGLIIDTTEVSGHLTVTITLTP